MPRYPFQSVESFGLMNTVRTVDLINIVSGVVMPHSSPREASVIRFGFGCFTVAIIVFVVSDLSSRISHFGQVTQQVVGKSGGQVQRAGSLCGRGFAPVLIVNRGGHDPRPASVPVNRISDVEVRLTRAGLKIIECFGLVQWILDTKHSIVIVVRIGRSLP